MPCVAVELPHDAQHLVPGHPEDVLPAALVGCERDGGARVVPDRRTGAAHRRVEARHLAGVAAEELEVGQVDVHGVHDGDLDDAVGRDVEAVRVLDLRHLPHLRVPADGLGGGRGEYDQAVAVPDVVGETAEGTREHRGQFEGVRLAHLADPELQDGRVGHVARRIRHSRRLVAALVDQAQSPAREAAEVGQQVETFGRGRGQRGQRRVEVDRDRARQQPAVAADLVQDPRHRVVLLVDEDDRRCARGSGWKSPPQRSAGTGTAGGRSGRKPWVRRDSHSAL